MKKVYFSFVLIFIALFLISCTSNESVVINGEEGIRELEKSSSGYLKTESSGNIYQIGEHTIEFISCVFDGTNTTFTYKVTSGISPSISHWNLQIPAECVDELVIVSSSEENVSYGYDGSTGTYGLKFDDGYSDGEERTVTLTLLGEWYVGEIGGLVKAGNGYEEGVLMGPICEDPGNGRETYIISGTTFFDIDGDGVQDADEPGISGVTLNLNDGTGVIGTTLSDSNGDYLFGDLEPGDYIVIAAGEEGMLYTTPETQNVTIVDSDVEDVDFGYNLDFTWIGDQCADGFTIGFWKNNIKKAIDGKKKGIQIDKATLEAYVVELSDFALSPLNIANLQDAYDILSATGSDAVLLLKKQLMGSEFNFANGAYIGDNETITFLFLYYGEYIILHAEDFNEALILEAKDWFDAYNNSHGGIIIPE